MKRARTLEQKQQRREIILKSARTIFQSTKYEQITLDEIAREAGLGKATLYSYFATREELFLALCQELLEAWFAQAHQQLGALSVPATAAQVAAAITEILPHHLDLMRLFPLMHSTIGPNVRPEVWWAYKQWFGPQIAQLGALFEALFPFIPHGEGKRITRYMYMLMLGMTQLPNGGRDQGGSQAGMPVIWLNDFNAAFGALLLGMERRSQ
jgi:AcrR family transcriptional regulator